MRRSEFGPSPASPESRLLQEAALMRGFLVMFLPWVFRILHPGTKPLILRWYLLAMCQALQKTAIGQTRRLVINVPPRHLKSITAVAYTAWMLGRNPRLKIMFVTYGIKLSREHLANLQRVMEHPFYRLLFPNSALDPGGISQQALSTTAGGGCRGVTVNGATMGFGADIILIDDAMKADDYASEARREELERFFATTLLSRLNDKRRGVIVSLQQRLGAYDLPARMIEAGADHLSLPSYDDKEVTYDIGFGRIYRRPVGEVLRPDDEPREVLDRIRREMGPRPFAVQYLQEPEAADGSIIPTDKFARFDAGEYPRRVFHKIVQSWDTATSEEPTADYSVCLTFGYLDGRWYTLGCLRDHMSYTKLRDRIIAQKELWGADKVLIEKANAGDHLWDDFLRSGALRPILIPPRADKVTRMVGQTALIEDGDVLLPHEAPWLLAFLSELRSFPNGKHDDQVDALSQFLEWSKSHDRWARTERDPKTGRKFHVQRRPKRRF